MKSAKTFKKVVVSIFCALAVLCTGFVAFNLNGGNLAYALVNSDDAIVVGELWEGTQGSFNPENLSDLIGRLFGDEDPVEYIKADANQSMVTKNNGDKQTEYSVSGSYVVNAKTINEKVGNVDNGLIVTLGGKKWILTSLTLANRFESDADEDRKVENDDVIATLYLADDYDTLSKVTNSADNVTGNNSYSSSVLRNNLLTWQDFKLFSSGQFAENYLVQPKYIKYQEVETTYNRQNCPERNCSLPNDAYGVPKDGTETAPWTLSGYSNPEEVFNGVKYNEWKNDYIWTPSAAETGFTNRLQESSIWRLTYNQLRHTKTFSWLRSGNSHYVPHCYYVGSAGTWYGADTNTDGGVRPAIHFNLTKAQENANYFFKEPQDVDNVVYNGEDQSVFTLTEKPDWYSSSFENSNIFTFSNYSKNNSPVTEMKDSGEYWIKVEINQSFIDETIASGKEVCFGGTPDTSDTDHLETDTIRWFKFTINKKKVAVNLQTDPDGFFVASINDENEIFTSDMVAGRKPVFGVVYDSSDGKGYHFDETTEPTRPNKVGQYTVTAKIINDCNYEIDTTQNYTATFTKEKTKVAKPNLPVKSLVYNGDTQEFRLMNWSNDSKVSVTSMTDGMSFDADAGLLKAKTAKKYSIKISLKEPEDYEWLGENNSDDFTLEIEITKKPLTLTIESDSGWAWKADETPTVTITGDSYPNDRTELYIYYYKNGDPATKYDDINANKVLSADKKTRTIVMPKLAPGIYVIGIEIFGSNYTNDCYQLVGEVKTQSFTVEGSTVTLEHPVWTCNGEVVSDRDNAKYTYTGRPFDLAVDEEDLRAHGMEIDISQGTNGFSGDVRAIDAGQYTVTVYLKSLENYEQKTATHVLNYTIEKAKYDLSKLSWNYSNSNKKYFIAGTTQSVALNGTIPTGLTAVYNNKCSGMAVGTYSASVSFDNSNSKNYFTPTKGKPETYIGDFAWDCLWEIEKATLDAEWDLGGSSQGAYIPKLKPIGSITLNTMVDYTYYETNENYDESSKTPIKFEDIGKDANNEHFYIVEARLKEVNAQNYILNPQVPTQTFSVGSNKYVIQLYITINGEALKSSYAYTGTPSAVKIHFTANPSGLGEEDILITYYKDGSSVGSTDIPTAVGKYHAVITISGGNDTSIIGDTCDSFDFEIVKADLDVSNLKVQYTHDGEVATFNIDQQKWVDGNNLELSDIKFNGAEHIVELLGLDTLPAALRAKIAGANSEGKIVYVNAGNYTIDIEFVYDESCYNAPDFATSIPLNIAKAKVDTSKIVWGYVVNNGKDEFPYTGALEYRRSGSAQSSSAVEYTLKLINVPEDLLNCIKYSGDITKSSANVTGAYQVSYAIDYSIFNADNFEECSMPSGLKSTLDWEIKHKYLDIPVYNGTWTVFDDEIHSFDEMCGLQEDWYLYYDMTITKDGNVYLGLDAEVFENEEDGEIKAYDAGEYVLKFTLKNALTDFYWKERFQDITISVEKISINIVRWQKAGISAEVETDFADFKHYTEYRFKDSDGTIVRPEDVAGAINAEFVKEIFVKSKYVNSVELVGEIEHFFSTGEGGRTFVDKPTMPDNLVFTGEEFDIEAILVENAGSFNYKPLIMEISGETKGTAVGKYDVTITLTDINYRWQDEEANVSSITLTWEIKDIVKEVLPKPTFPEIFFSGEDIDITSQIVGFDPKIMEFVTGSQTVGKNAGVYTVTIRLNSNKYTWKTTEDVKRSRARSSEFEEIELTWEIKKARISGNWEIKDGYCVFVPTNVANGDKFTTKYFDKDGKEIAIENMSEGETYKVQLLLNDSANYEFVSLDNVSIDTEKEFAYEGEAGIWDFIKENWMWFLILLILLILLLILIIVIAVLKKRDKKEGGKSAQSENDKRQEERLRNLERRMARVYDMDGGEVVHDYELDMNDNEMDALRAEVLRLRKYKLEEEKRNSQGIIMNEIPALGAEEIRGIVSETMTAMLPNVQQYLPQQASANDELIQKLTEQNAQNEERIRQLSERNDEMLRKLAESQEMLMKKLAEQNKDNGNEELIQKLMEQNAQNEERIAMLMSKLSEQSASEVSEETIEKLAKKLSEQQASEKVEEKELAATMVNEEMIKELVDGQKEIQNKLGELTAEKEEKRENEESAIVKELQETVKVLQAQLKDTANVGNERVVERIVEVEKKEDKIEMLMRNQDMLMQRLNELAFNNAINRQIVGVPIVQQPVEKIVEAPIEKHAEKQSKVEESVGMSVAVPTRKSESKSSVSAPRITLDDAYEKLSAKQKKFFDTLKEYAMSKDKCKEKKSTYYILLGQSSVNPLVKLTVKKNTTVAMFKMEDEYFKDIRRNAGSDGTKMKVKETELVVGDAQALATAKEMIDLREDQIERYNEYLKEQRSMKKR